MSENIPPRMKMVFQCRVPVSRENMRFICENSTCLWRVLYDTGLQHIVVWMNANVSDVMKQDAEQRKVLAQLINDDQQTEAFLDGANDTMFWEENGEQKSLKLDVARYEVDVQITDCKSLSEHWHSLQEAFTRAPFFSFNLELQPHQFGAVTN